jgi:protein involved in polysaccharide export with SLBB domain
MTGSFWHFTRWLPVILLLFGLLWGGCRSVEPVYQPVTTSSDMATADVYDATHQFQVGELVTIHYPGIQNVPKQHKERIKEDGTISLPLIGLLAVAGKTPVEVQQLLQEEYAVFVRPLVLPPPRRTPCFFVNGEVRSPGPKAYLGETTVTTAIQSAGDFTEAANKKKVKLIRSDGRRETIDVVDLLQAVDPPNDPQVYPGDKIEVPRKWWR